MLIGKTLDFRTRNEHAIETIVNERASDSCAFSHNIFSPVVELFGKRKKRKSDFSVSNACVVCAIDSVCFVSNGSVLIES